MIRAVKRALVLLGLAGCTSAPVLTERDLAEHPNRVRHELRTLPVVSERDAFFVLDAPDAKAVEIAGDFTDWQPRAIRRSGPFWHERVPFDVRARVEYQFIVDGKWTLDPRNERSCDNGVGGRNSWIAMPGYRAIAPPSAPAGRLDEHDVAGHRVWVYVPAGAGPFASMYFHDGEDYLKRADAAARLDAHGLIGVFVKPVDRGREYWCDEAYTTFFAELVAWVDAKYPTIADRARRGIMGASLGGLISLHIAYELPRIFGRVATQSGAFYNEGGRDRPATKVFDRVTTSRVHPLRLHVSCGLYEGLLAQNRVLDGLLRGLKVDHAYEEHPQGHAWTLWRDTLPGILDHLWKR